MKIAPFLGTLKQIGAEREPLADDIDDCWSYESIKGPDYGFQIQVDREETVASLTIIFVSDWSLRPSLYPPGQGPWQYLEDKAKKPTPQRRIALIEQLFRTTIAQLELKVPEITVDGFRSAGFTPSADGKSMNWKCGSRAIRVSLYDGKVTGFHYSLGNNEE